MEKIELKMEETLQTPTISKRWRAYRKYRDSGVKWLGKIPEHWEVRRLKFAASFLGGGTPSKENPEYWTGDIPWVSPKDMKSEEITDTEEHITEEAVNSSATRIISSGAVLIVMRSGILRHTIPVAINAVPTAINQDLKAIVPKSFLYPKYLANLIRGLQDALLVEWRKQGATVESIEFELLANTLCPFSPLKEQFAIVTSLDQKTSRIDSLLTQKEQLIKLLQEKRAALISQAVTRGLNSEVRLKDSGVAWLGMVPKHWEIKRLKSLAVDGLVNGLFKKKDQFGTGTKLVNVVDIYQDNFQIDLSNVDRVKTTSAELRVYQVIPGDIFFVRSSLKLEGVGASACVLDVSEPAVFECHLVRLRPDPKQVLPMYLTNYLNSSITRQRLVALANTTTMTTISQYELASIEIPVPPLSEQEHINFIIFQETAKIDALISRIREGIEKVKEYRAALISAAVTGKIDVRGELAMEESVEEGAAD